MKNSETVNNSYASNKRIVIILSLIILVLSLISTLTGVFSRQVKEYADVTTVFGENVQLYQKGLYARDSVSMASQAIAQDVVTLLIVIPFLLVSLWLVKKQNRKGLFLLTGIIGYFLYTYTSYSFLIVFNSFYLVYVLLMTLSFYGFILCFMELSKLDIGECLTERFPRKALSVFFFTGGIMIMLMWLGKIVPALLAGSAPAQLEHYATLVIQSLDLGFVVPACIVTAHLLRKENKWGYLLAIVLVVKMVTMTATVSAMAIQMKRNGVYVGLDEQLLFLVLFLISAFFMIKMLREIKA